MLNKWIDRCTSKQVSGLHIQKNGLHTDAEI